MRRPAVLILGLLALVSPALGDEMTMPMAHGGASSAAEKANAAAMHAMMKGMAGKSTGNPDKDFARMMMAHHEGAIAMAKVELQYGKDPELQALARDIVSAQEKEIAQMKAWLAAHP